MKKFLIALMGGLMTVGILGFDAQPVQAAEDQNDYEIQPILPDNQLNKSANYFDLQARPGKTQKLQMRVHNFTGKTITVTSQLRNAYTQDGGGIDFTATVRRLSETLKQPLTSLITLDKAARRMKLAPHEVRVITATVKMPTTQHTGLIYGDWQFSERVRPQQGQSTAVKANYAYSLGIALWGKDRSAIHPDFKYRQTEPFLYNKHPALAVTLANVNPMMLKNATIKAVISRQGDGGMARSFSSTNAKIAPNSDIRLPISWNYDAMKPGTYRIKALISGQSYVTRLPMKWQFNKTIRVAEKVATKLNRQAVQQPQNYWLYASLAVGALWLLAVGAVIWLFAVRPQ